VRRTKKGERIIKQKYMIEENKPKTKEETAQNVWESWVKDSVYEQDDVQNSDDEDCTAYED